MTNLKISNKNWEIFFCSFIHPLAVWRLVWCFGTPHCCSTWRLLPVGRSCPTFHTGNILISSFILHSFILLHWVSIFTVVLWEPSPHALSPPSYSVSIYLQDKIAIFATSVTTVKHTSTSSSSFKDARFWIWDDWESNPGILDRRLVLCALEVRDPVPLSIGQIVTLSVKSNKAIKLLSVTIRWR